MTESLLTIFFIFLALSAGIGYWHPRFWLGTTLLACLGGLLAAGRILGCGEIWFWRGALALGGEMPILRLDAVSALFLVLISLVGGLGALYSAEYWSDHHAPHSAPRGRCWWSLMLLGMGLVITCGNSLHFLLAWELFAVSAYFLITLENERPEVRKAGWLYLAVSHAGTLLLLVFFSELAIQTKTWEIGPMHAQTTLAPLFWLALLGFGVKAGMFPLHIWLPSAHAGAPSHVSAIMSAVAIKMGIYGIIRFSGWMPLPHNAGWVLLALGAASALFGIVFALAQNDLKRLLAYCSVENIGIILMGLGLCLLATERGYPAWGQIALAGVFLHILGHALAKSLLFFAAGSVVQATDTRDLNRLGGLWRPLPWTTSFFALGAMAMSSLPPLSGFVSEWTIALGFLTVIAQKGPLAGTLLVLLILMATSALALATFAKATGIAFLGAPRTAAATKAQECGWCMRLPMLLGTVGIIAIGLVPALFFVPILGITTAWAPNWTPTAILMQTKSLGAAHTLLACALLVGSLLIVAKIRLKTRRRAPTWDCGYARPTARMQYTAGSFSDIVTGWCSWILQPEILRRRIRGHFPDTGILVTHTPDTVLEKIFIPLATTFIRLANTTRKIQHGRLHLYIFYVFLGLLGVGLLVFEGGL